MYLDRDFALELWIPGTIHLAAAAALAALKRDSLVATYLPSSLLKLAGSICGPKIESFPKVTKTLLATNERIEDLENTGERLLALGRRTAFDSMLVRSRT